MSAYHFIVNPVAGAGSAKGSFETIEALLKEQGVDYSVSYTQFAGHAKDLAREALLEDHGCIAAVGGDGTMLEVAQVMAHTGRLMGLIPAGTGNDLARGLKIPLEPKAALDVLLKGNDVFIDGGTANGHQFFNVGGMGFDVDVLLYTERYKKHFSGSMAYLLGVLRALFGYKLRNVTVKSEELTMTAPSLIIAAANGTYYGGGMNMAPLGSLTDGLLDVCLIHNVNFFVILRVLPKFMKGKHLPFKKYVTYWKTKEVTVTAEPSSPLQLDGEVLDSTPVTYKVDEKALLIRCAL